MILSELISLLQNQVCMLSAKVSQQEAEMQNKLYAWALFEPYKVGDRVAFDSISFRCKLANVGAPENMPGQGADWRTYWEENIPVTTP